MSAGVGHCSVCLITVVFCVFVRCQCDSSLIELLFSVRCYLLLFGVRVRCSCSLRVFLLLLL